MGKTRDINHLSLIKYFGINLKRTRESEMTQLFFNKELVKENSISTHGTLCSLQ